MPFPHRRFRQRREELGMTRKELADKAGVPVRSLDGLEQGLVPSPGLETLKLLCKALDVSCEFFFTDDLLAETEPAPVGRPKKQPAPEPSPEPKKSRGKKA